MKEKIENCLRGLIATLQIARLYPNWHPEFKKSIDKLFIVLKDVLTERQELIIGIVADELAFEKEVFFDLSKNTKPTIEYLKQKGLERIVFYRSLQKEELSAFINLLSLRKEELKHSVEEELSILGVRSIAVSKIANLDSEKDTYKHVEEISYINIYENALNNVSSSVEEALEGSDIDPLALRLTMVDVMNNLLGRYQELLNIATIKRYDLKTFSHILHVAILSMYFSSKLGLNRDEILDIGIAGLFHDIGKTYISRKIIQKPDRLTEQEFSEIKSHVLIGSELMLKYVKVLGILPVVVCFEHHLKHNLSGYPKISNYKKQHIASAIVSICDVYDALSQKRVYKDYYSPEMIYNIMSKESSTAFDPSLLDRFFRFSGVWPIGTIVRLNDKRVAIVRRINENDIFNPIVEIIGTQGELVDLFINKDKFKIESSLNPVTEGKQYLSLI